MLKKKFAGNRFGAEAASGTAAQLISRRPLAIGPAATPLLIPPKDTAVLKAFTAVRISAGVAPDASNTSGSAEAATGLNMNAKPRVAIASKRECLMRGAEVRFEVSNGGVVPRWLVVELLLDCMDCIILVRIEVELFMAELFYSG